MMLLYIIQPLPLFFILLQPHPVLISVATTSSSFPYVATISSSNTVLDVAITSSSITLGFYNLLLYYFRFLQPPPLLLVFATTASSIPYVATSYNLILDSLRCYNLILAT